MTSKPKKTGLELLREPFTANQISKLPKPTKFQTDTVKSDFKKGIRCGDCGGWHHPDVVHLDYVGHAALTDRLLDCDLEWNWEPVATTEDGTPKFDSIGGMWIRLTVCGVTRLGYGDAQGKSGGNAIKEVIGDALRNAAMRFGAALDLWHKGDLHVDDAGNGDDTPPKQVNGRVEDVRPPEGTPFDDDPDYDPVEVADRMLDGLKHTADGDLGGWSKANRGNLDRLRKSSHAEFTRVLDECIDRKARIRKEDTE